jgi:CxxC motif-containing protein
MTKREMVCVSCPMGCAITVELDDNNEVISVTGNTCPRGDKYARQECTHPERMLTSTVKVEGGRLPVVPVKSASPIPKEMLFDAMKEVNKVTLKAPVTFGDVAVKDILGTGIDIVVTNEA